MATLFKIPWLCGGYVVLCTTCLRGRDAQSFRLDHSKKEEVTEGTCDLCKVRKRTEIAAADCYAD